MNTKVKRVFALIGVALLLSLYLITFISAIIQSEFFKNLFMASLYSTIIIPVFIYVGILIYKRVHKK